MGFGVMATGVFATSTGIPTLAGIMNRNAFSLALDGWSFLDEKRTYVVGGWFGGTRVAGSAEDILRLQYSSIHYFQRPDADPRRDRSGGHVPDAAGADASASPSRAATSSGSGRWARCRPASIPTTPDSSLPARTSSTSLSCPATVDKTRERSSSRPWSAAGVFRITTSAGTKAGEARSSSVQGVFRNFWSFN